MSNTVLNLEIIDEKLDFLHKNYFISLAVICLVAIGIRVYFTPFDFPLESLDALNFLHQAK